MCGINDSFSLQLIIRSVEGGSLLKGEDRLETKPARVSRHWPLSEKPSSTEDYVLLFGHRGNL